jgi:hypothetical protein
VKKLWVKARLFVGGSTHKYYKNDIKLLNEGGVQKIKQKLSETIMGRSEIT